MPVEAGVGNVDHNLYDIIIGTLVTTVGGVILLVLTRYFSRQDAIEKRIRAIEDELLIEHPGYKYRRTEEEMDRSD